MNQDQRARQRFVDRKLAPCVQSASGSAIAAVDYWVDAQGEWVRLRRPKRMVDSMVYVADMSLPELAIAVLKAI